MDINHTCNTCLFYRAHYAKDDNNCYYQLQSGHCTNSHIGVASFKRCKKHTCDCYYWQQSNNGNEPIDIIEIIRNMATRIEQIATQLDI